MKRINKKNVLMLVILVLLGVKILPNLNEKVFGKENNLELFKTLGVLNIDPTRKDASGTPLLRILTMDTTGIPRYLRMNTDELEGNFEKVLEKRGVIKKRYHNGDMEKHLLVYNPRDTHHVLTWVPLKDVRKVAKTIKETGYTVPRKIKKRKATQQDAKKTTFDVSF